MTTRHALISAVMFIWILALPFAVFAQDAGNNTDNQPPESDNTNGETPPSNVPNPLDAATNGIFGCNQTGAYAMSVGSLRATGGSAVPVSDNAVTLNSGYIVYKECVLRPVVDAERRVVTEKYVVQELNQFNSGNNGNAYYVQDYDKELYDAGDRAFQSSFFSVTDPLNTAIKNPVQVALARNYQLRTQSPQSAVTCPYTGDLAAALKGRPTDFWASLDALVLYPGCSPHQAYLISQNQLNANIASAQDAWRTQLSWSRGCYPVVDSSGRIVTPGALVCDKAEQAITSGFRQLENADDIGEMVGKVFAGVGSRIMNGSLGGLADIGKSIGGQPSYVQQLDAEASQDLMRVITNTVLSVLAPALRVEGEYRDAYNAMLGALRDAKARLRGAESVCWNLVITGSETGTPSASSTRPHVCQSSVEWGAAGATCSAAGGANVNIATTTQGFAEKAISENITPLEEAVVANINASNVLMTTFNQLIASFQGGNAAVAANQANALIASFDMQKGAAARERLQTVQAALFDSQAPGFVPKTLQTWAGETGQTDNFGTRVTVAWDGSTPLGWCNVNKQETITAWTSAWTR